MPSLRSRIVAGAASLTRVRDWQFHPARFTSARPSRPPRYAVPKNLRQRVDIEESRFEGWPVVTLTPPSVRGGEVLYLHGGAWCAEIKDGHWRFVVDLAVRTGRPVVVPIFPLAPVATHRDVLPVLQRLYTGLAVDGPVTVMGDSSGAALALSMTAHLPVGVFRPEHLVLLSPPADLTFSNPELVEVAAADPLLRLDHIREHARRYAGVEGPANPAVSPIHGPLAGLGRVTIFTSDRDVLHPDVLRLRDLAAEAPGTTVTLHEFPGMLHDWMLQPIPEARRVLSMLTDLLAS